MLNEALLASELLAEKGIGLQVVNMPWLNQVDLGMAAADRYTIPVCICTGRPCSRGWFGGLPVECTE